MSARRLLAYYGSLVAVLALADILLPEEYHLVVWVAIGLSSVAALLVGVRRYAPRHKAIWVWLAVAVACLLLGDAVQDTFDRVLHRDSPFPFAHLFYLLMYLLVMAVIAVLYRLGVVRRDPTSLLDALILTTAVGLLAWSFWVGPRVRLARLPLEMTIPITYPLSDITILMVGFRLFAAFGATPSVLMLGMGLAGRVCSDVAHGLFRLLGFWPFGRVIDLGWVAMYGLWGAAALHPSMRSLTEPKVLPRREDRLRQLVLPGLAALVAPTLLMVEARVGSMRLGATIPVMSATLSLLVLLRLGYTVRSQHQFMRRERGLSQAGAALLVATDPAEVDSVVRGAVRRLLPPGRPSRVAFVLAAAGPPAPTGAGPPVPVAMVYTRTLDASVAEQLSGFEVALCCPLYTVSQPDQYGTGRAEHPPDHAVLGALYVAADEANLATVQDSVQVLANQAALAFARIAMSVEIDRRNSEAYFRTLVLNASDVILVLDDADRVQHASPSASMLFLLPDVTGMRLTDLVAAGSLLDVRARLARVRAGHPDQHDRDWWMRRADNRLVRVEAFCRDVRAESTLSRQRYNLVVTLRDVTDSRRLAAELYQRATVDTLTGLPSREWILGAAQEAIQRTVGMGAAVAMFVLELDDFKQVNSTMGHDAGDELLVIVGERLAAAVRSYPGLGPQPQEPRPETRTSEAQRPESHRPEEIPGAGGAGRMVARLGGDEFAVMLSQAGGRLDVARAAEQFMSIFVEPFVLSQGPVSVTASMGVATATEAIDAQELLRQADLAVYVAKDAGKGRWVQYDPSLHTRVLDRLKLRVDLERAVTDGVFLLHYQPIVTLAGDHRAVGAEGRVVGRTVGFEALVRWDHPTRGILSPAHFIGVAESSGLIVALGSWVLNHAAKAAALWRRLFPETSLYVSVNVSPRQLHKPGFVEQVREELARSGLPYECLMLEVTESVLLREGSMVSDQLSTLRSYGVRVAIDDFGTGFSSLSYLRQLPVDILKIDKSFIDSITCSLEQSAVVDAIIQLARTLRLRVVAEGIETAEQLDLLIAMGCEFGQGYLLARPMSYGDCLDWLAAERSLPPGTARAG